jgi:hypothetical protein
MAITVQCGACGKSFQAKDEWAGKRVKCGGCGSPVAVPAAGAQARPGQPAAAAKPAAGGIAVACNACGTRFQVAATLAGKRVKCKQCGAAVAVPGAAGAVSGAAPAAHKAAPSAAQAAPAAANPLASLLDEEIAAGKIQTPPVFAQRRCGRCGEPMAEHAVICVKCGFDSRTGSLVTGERPKRVRRPGQNTPVGIISAVLSILWGVVATPVAAVLMFLMFFAIIEWVGSLSEPDTPDHVKRELGQKAVVFPIMTVFFVGSILMFVSGINVLRIKKGAAGTTAISSGVIIAMLIFSTAIFFFMAWSEGAFEDRKPPAPNEPPPNEFFMVDATDVILIFLGVGSMLTMVGFVHIWSITQGRRLDFEIPEEEFTKKVDTVVDITQKPVFTESKYAPKKEEGPTQAQGWAAIGIGFVIGVIGGVLMLVAQFNEIDVLWYIGWVVGFMGGVLELSGAGTVAQTKGYPNYLGVLLVIFCSIPGLIILAVLPKKA